MKQALVIIVAVTAVMFGGAALLAALGPGQKAAPTCAEWQTNYRTYGSPMNGVSRVPAGQTCVRYE